jgi:hypothetical protein
MWCLCSKEVLIAMLLHNLFEHLLKEMIVERHVRFVEQCLVRQATIFYIEVNG